MILASFALSSPSSAEEPWEFRITPYLWAPSIDGEFAVSTYLLNGLQPAAVPEQSSAEMEALAAADKPYSFDMTAGQALYLSNCSLCHGANGQGIPNTMPPLDGNSTVAQTDAVNLVLVIAGGLEQKASGRGASYGPMPAFGNRLSVAQMTDLVNYLRAVFANDNAHLQELSAATIRSLLDE